MKKLILHITLLFGAFSQSYGQAGHIDSLIHALKSGNSDEQRLDILWQIAMYDQSRPDIAIQYGLQGIKLAEKLKKFHHQEDFLYAVGVGYHKIHDYPRSIEMAFRGLELSEKINDKEYHSTFLYGMSACYAKAGDFHAAITYAHKDIEWLKKTGVHAKSGNKETICILHNDIGKYYVKLNRLDSALIYMQESYRLSTAIKYERGIGLAALGLGMIEDQQGNADLAFSYYRMAIAKSESYDTGDAIRAHHYLGRLFHKSNEHDSAFYYSKKAYNFARQLNDHNAVSETANWLSDLYSPLNELEALRYFKIAATHKDSLNITEKAKEFQIVTARERQRQSELEEKAMKEQEIHKRNLKYAAIAVSIITFFILFFVFSRSVMVNEKIISFLAALGLLAVFEFINLLIHPYLEVLTHHSVELMLLILMFIGALLVPLHHKLEHWVMYKMIEKNKSIRLAAAKKTIEKMEKKTTES